MVHGGLGIQGIAQTEFYRFVSSPEGLSQLGIRPEDAEDLLQAYTKSFKLIASGKKLAFVFGDEEFLISETPHFASGQGDLTIQSWMEWVLSGDRVNDKGFVSRSDLPRTLRKNIRLSSPLGGLMLSGNSFGSDGQWEFPSELRGYADKWAVANGPLISSLIVTQFASFLRSELKK